MVHGGPLWQVSTFAGRNFKFLVVKILFLYIKFYRILYCIRCPTKMADSTRYLCVDERSCFGGIIDALKHNRASEVIEIY